MSKRAWLTKSRFQIGVISSLVLTIAVAIVASTIFLPAQAGLGRGYTRNIERDSANRIIKTIDVERDWLSLLGVPISLVILGFLLQLFQQKRLDEKAKEEVLQIYFDRLSKLLIDENLIALAKRGTGSVG